MTIAVVQAIGTSSTVDTSTATFASPTTTGNLIVVSIAAFTSSTPTTWATGTPVTDNKGNTYTFIQQRLGSGGSDSLQVAQFYCANANGGSGHIVTVNCPAPGVANNISIIEISNYNAAPLDKILTNTASGAGSATVGPTATLSQADEIAIAIAVVDSSTNSAFTQPGGWTLIDEEEDGTTFATYNCCYQIVSATTALTATWTHSYGTANYYAAIATFKGSAAASAPSAPSTIYANVDDGQVWLMVPVPADGGSAITDYLWEYNDGSWHTFSHSADPSNRIIITGLSNGTAYTFRASAINAIGTGSASPVSASVTPIAAGGPYPPPWRYPTTTLDRVTRQTATERSNTPAAMALVIQQMVFPFSVYTPPAQTISDALGLLDSSTSVTAYARSITDNMGITDTLFDATLKTPVSVSGRKILDQNGDVFLMPTMSSWGMPTQLTNAEITSSLEDIANLGFKGVTVWIGGGYEIGTAPTNWNRYTNEAGSNYWTGTPWASTLGSAWSTVDHLIDEAARVGLVVNASFCGGFSGTGAAPDWIGVTNTNMYNAGVAIATRYLAKTNIVWHIMLDDVTLTSDPAGVRIQNLFDGINDTEGAGTRPVRWMECNNGASTDNQGWLNAGNFNATINCIYEYTSDSVVQFETGWAETSGPTGDCEPPYVGAPHYTGTEAQQLRERNYAVFLEGGCVINFGHEDWWHFDADGLFTTGISWPAVMASTPLIQTSYCWSLIDTYCKYATWAPDGGTFLTTGTGSGDTKAASGFSDWAGIVYFPNSRTIAVDTTVLSGTGNVRLRWYDPTNGAFTSIATSEAQTAGRSVTHPGNNAQGHGDQVLVVDLVSGPPGGTNYSQTVDDPLGLLDSIAQVAASIRALTDPLGALDSISSATVKALTDALGMLDSISSATVRELTDPLGMLDSTSSALVRPIIDALGLLDSQTQVVVASQTVTDPLGMLDSTSSAMVLTFVDALGLLDSMAQNTGTQQTFSDNLGLLDSQTQVVSVAQAITDALGMLDSTSVTVTMTLVVTDALGLLDSTTQQAVYILVVTDNEGLLDSIAIGIGVSQSFTDVLGLLDPFAQFTGTQQTFTEAIGLLDSHTRVIAVSASATDALGMLDSSTRSVVYSSSFTDVLGMLDSQTATAILSRSSTDPLGMLDSNTAVNGTLLVLSDTLGLSDSSTLQTNITKIVSDSLGILDSSVFASTFVTAISDVLGISDNVTDVEQTLRVVIDTMGLLDSETSSIGVITTLADILGISDDAVASFLELMQIGSYWGIKSY